MSKIIIYDWLKVLNHFDQKGYFQNGLTIPFLIGSRTITNPKQEILSVNDFFNELFDSKILIKILRCDYLGEYVISSFDYESNELRLNRIKKDKPLYREFGNLIIMDNSFKELSLNNQLISALSQSYQENINNGLFSRETGKWTPYSEKDKQRIKEVKF